MRLALKGLHASSQMAASPTSERQQRVAQRRPPAQPRRRIAVIKLEDADS